MGCGFLNFVVNCLVDFGIFRLNCSWFIWWEVGLLCGIGIERWGILIGWFKFGKLKFIWIGCERILVVMILNYIYKRYERSYIKVVISL